MTEKYRTIHVGQGEHQVSGDPSVVFATVLGSCVSTCLYDQTLGLGGLNHMVLPNDRKDDPFNIMNQVNAMECLINALLRKGALRRNLVAKAFGGANLIGSSAAVGAKNANFVRDFLRDEGIPIKSESLGGAQARRLKFHPTTGRVQLKFVKDVPPERPVAPVAVAQNTSGLELF